MLNSKEIESLLTLRYNYHSTPFLPHKNIKDFEPWDEPKTGWARYIQTSLEMKIWEELNQYDTIGISLSSGLDSTLLLALIRKVFPKKDIRACIDNCSGEEARAEEQAIKYGAKINLLSLNSVLPKLSEYVKIAQEPRYNVYHEAMAKLAQVVGCDVLVTGDGGDELFGGYIFRYNQFNNLNDGYLYCHLNDWVDDQSDLIKGFSWFNYELMFGKRTIPTLQQVMLADYNGKLLHEFLPLGRKISRYHNIPIKTPFMELRDIATHIPIDRQMTLGQNPVGKLVLREIADNIGLEHSPTKIGYSVDIVSEYERNERRIWEKIENINPKVYDYINVDWLKNHRMDYSKRTINKIYQILALGEYLN